MARKPFARKPPWAMCRCYLAVLTKLGLQVMVFTNAPATNLAATLLTYDRYGYQACGELNPGVTIQDVVDQTDFAATDTSNLHDKYNTTCNALGYKTPFDGDWRK